MKKIYQIYLIAMIVFTNISCDKNNNAEPVPQDNIEDCKIEEFYARMLINGACWTSTVGFFDTINGAYDLRFGIIANLTEDFNFRLDKKYDITDTYFYTGDVNSFVVFGVLEGFDALVVAFTPKYLIDKGSNWIAIDSINSDSTIISGRFEAILYRDGEGNQAIYPSPEKLVIKDGQFRVERR